MAVEPEQSMLAPSFSNLDFVEKLYFDYLADPRSVEPEWRAYFERLPRVEARPAHPFPRRADAPLGGGSCDECAEAVHYETIQFRVDRLVQAYREHGHLHAKLDPLGLERRGKEPISLSSFGLSEADLDALVLRETGTTTLRELVARLEETYCRTLGVELAHLHEAELFEAFLGTRFLGAKRFSLEGAEGLVPMLELIIDRAVGHGVKDIAIGMAHRGRLNVLANVLGKPARQIFAEFRDNAIVSGGGGDVKYHLGYQGEHATPEGAPVQVSLAFNPSHLEWIDAVVQGKV